MKLFRTAATIVFTLISFSAAATDYLAPRGIMTSRYLFGLAGGLVAARVLHSAPSEARIVRIEVTKVEPAFGGQTFGDVGAYERVIGRAYGEVDPGAPANAIIQDIGLAPRNAKGSSNTSPTSTFCGRPIAPRATAYCSLTLLNRGNKGGLAAFNADVPVNVADNNAVKVAGDGFMMKQGYTMVWFGWQGDVLPGNNRMTLTVPVAKNADGSPITGVVRGELIVRAAPAKTLNLSSGWFTVLTHASYPTVSVDNRTPLADGFLPTLTVRAKEQEPRVAIANTEWSFGSCPEGAPVTPAIAKSASHRGFSRAASMS